MTPIASTSSPATTTTAPSTSTTSSTAEATSTGTPAASAPTSPAAVDTFEAGGTAARPAVPDMCLVDAPVDPELNAVLQSQLQSQMRQAHLGAPPQATSGTYTSDASFGTQAAQTALLFASGMTDGAFGASDPSPAIQKAIQNDSRLGDGNDGLTEAAELVGHGTGSIFPEWMANLGPRPNTDNMHRAGPTYDNGFKEWSKSTDDGETWQRYVGRADDKAMPASGLAYGEGVPVDDDFDVNTLKPVK